MNTQRNYRGKDVYMLLVAKTILQSLQKYLSELSAVRPIWTAEFVANLIARIDEAMEKYLGLDKRKGQRMASANVYAIQKPAHKDLSFIKTQLQVDFKAEKDKLNEMFKTLGFANGKGMNKTDQEALIEHLYAFKKGMTEELKAEIVAKGVGAELIDRIINYATELIEANQAQESLKEQTKELTNEALTVLNGIYDEIIGICKIASNFYYDDPIKKEQFTYGYVLDGMIGAKKKNNGEETNNEQESPVDEEESVA